MTQEQLADLLNVSKRSVQDYEAGETIPWKHFSRLEQVFGRDLGWFLHGEAESDAGATDVASKIDDLRLLVEGVDRKIDTLDVPGRLVALEEQLRDLRAALNDVLSVRSGG